MPKKKFDVEINFNWCKRCGLCYWICPTKAIVEGDLMYPRIDDADKCIGCLLCENVCPEMAIDILERKEATVKE